MKCVFISALCFMIIGCGLRKENDIYSFIKKNEKISFSDLRNMKQLVKVGESYFFLYDISNDREIFSPHVLFCDSNIYLRGSAYYPSEYIDTIIGDTVIGVINKYREGRINAYRDDLPSGKTCFLKNRDVNNGYSRKNQIIIDSVGYFLEDFKVRFFVRNSHDQFGWRLKGYDSNKNPEFYLGDFIERDTLDIPISKLYFSRHEQYQVSVLDVSDNSRTWNNMLILDNSLLDDFFNRIWIQIQ